MHEAESYDYFFKPLSRSCYHWGPLYCGGLTITPFSIMFEPFPDPWAVCPCTVYPTNHAIQPSFGCRAVLASIYAITA